MAPACKSPASLRLRQIGVTQKQVAAELGKTQQAVHYYLTGEVRPPKELREAIASLSSSRKAKSVIDLIPSS